MPGGPTDPDKLLEAIQAGATPDDGRLVLPRAGARWLAIVDDDERGPRWVLTLTRGVQMTPETFEMVAKARSKERFLFVNDVRFALEVSDYGEEQFAELAPA